MKRRNGLVTTEEGAIVHIGEDVLPYMNLSGETPFAYPSDKLQQADSVLFVSRKWNREEAALFERIGIGAESLKELAETGVLLLGIFEDSQVQSITKHGEALLTRGKSTLLDTFFYGSDVKVEWDGEEENLTVQINGQILRCPLPEGDDQLVVFRKSGLCYFRTEEGASRRDSNDVLLSGLPFHSYIRKVMLPELRLNHLFSAELAERMMGMRDEEIQYFYRNDRAAAVSCMVWERNGRMYRSYMICRQEELLAAMREETSVYQELVRLAEERFGKTSIPTTFGLWGNDQEMSQVKRLLQKACNTNVTVLLTGESGTGKTFLAKEIHQSSKRGHQNFVHVNCAAIPYHLIESELFGYEDGAFTGAKRGGKKGYFETAQEGTIFLDEITELPLPLQGRLLEVIQNRTFYRVGGNEKIHVNVRLIAATNKELKEQVAKGEFREDLYYRIHVFPIQIPPLRKRRETLLTIVTDILPEICRKVELEPLLVSPQALEKIKGYHWPGNVRELENVLEKAAILCDGKAILPEDVVLPSETARERESGGTLKEQRERCEKKAIAAALAKFGGDKGKTARYLDIGRTSLFEKIRKYHIRDYRVGGQDDTEPNQ